MKEFNYLDYHTEYSCTGDISVDMSGYACFSNVFWSLRNGMKNTYTVILHCNVEEASNEHKSNLCLLDINRVKNHLRLLKPLFPFRFRVTQKTPDIIQVILKIDGGKATYHKYALTWLRYTYEFPYNVLLRDAYELKTDPTFRFESIANIFNVCLGSYCGELRSIHQVPIEYQTPSRITNEDLKKKIKAVVELNDIYDKYKKSLEIPDTINKYDIFDLEYWDTGFGIRKEIYLKNYKAK